MTLADVTRELAQAHYEKAVSQSNFNRFYYCPIDFFHFDDIAHMEKNIVHGIQREYEDQVGAVSQPDLPIHASSWDGGAFEPSPTPTAPVVGSIPHTAPSASRRVGTRSSIAADPLPAPVPDPIPVPVDATAPVRKLWGLNTANLIRIASKYSEFAPILKVLNALVDKQHVPSARLIMRGKLFHAALWKHGFKREAAVLSVLNGVAETFDCGKLLPSYRDYLCARARHLIYLLLGSELDDCKMAAVSGGSSKSCGIETALLYRFLSNIDAREQLIKQLGHYLVERALGTDDLENFFSELCRRSRSSRNSPNCQTAMIVARTAERAAKFLWDGRWRKYESKRKRYTKAERTTYNDWNCGARVPSWWPLELATAVQVVANKKVKAEKRMHKAGESKTQYSAVSVRTQHSAASKQQVAPG